MHGGFGCGAMARKLTHVGRDGKARMVDVGAKAETHRVARAEAVVKMSAGTLSLINAGKVGKGDVFGVAKLAGIQAAKRTAELIPLCHPLRLTKIDVAIEARPPGAVRIEARVEARDRTGVEMEAMTAACVAALTIYDMCKAAERTIEITGVRLIEKAGGKSGHFVRPDL